MSAAIEPQQAFKGVAATLLEHGYINRSEAARITTRAQTRKVSPVVQAIEEGMIQDRVLANLVAREYGLPLLDLSAMKAEQLPLAFFNETLANTLQAVVIRAQDDMLTVAIYDPLNYTALDTYAQRYKIRTEPVLVECNKLRQMLRTAQELAGNHSNLSALIDAVEIDDAVSEALLPQHSHLSDNNTDDAPAVRFVNSLILNAVKQAASDVHLEPFEHDYRVRLRCDGVLHETTRVPSMLAERAVARIKVMAQLNVSERRLPQDGRLRVHINSHRAIDFRINSCPTVYGEKMVLRQLASDTTQLSIDGLGLSGQQHSLYQQALAQSHGMILVTGPTGSGKTVTLYAGLSQLNTPERNISTVEDPAEIILPGVNQVNVQSKIGLTFAEAMRAFLRQDPDVIMVGEIRDAETASIASRAAQTGHLVLATLHTNDATQTLQRLHDMGIPSYSLASSLSLVIAQRLVRKLCRHCAQPVELDPVLIERYEHTGALTPRRAVGCSRCHNGYAGRTGVYEFLPISERIQQHIAAHDTAQQIRATAIKEGMQTLQHSAFALVAQGITSWPELERVVQA